MGTEISELEVSAEKTLTGISVGKHGIRMDLYVTEKISEDSRKKTENINVYNIEPNAYKEVPFGKNRMIYKVKNIVEDEPEVLYNDGVLKLFLYIHGTVGGNEKIKNLLDYFGNTTYANAVDSELGRAEGRAEGLKEGIIGTIKVCKKMNFSREDSRLHLIDSFSLTDEQAEELMTELWDK